MNEVNELQISINQTEKILNELKMKRQNIIEKEKYDYQREIKKNFELRPEHIKLLKEMEFKGLWYGDIVSIGVDGKRPFGNSYMYRDIANILDWKLPNDDLSDEQLKTAQKLIAELPLAVNKIIKNIIC